MAEAEHGGFYQALADGTYRKYGLDVTIVPGGPNVNNRILLPVGKIDFFLSADTLQGFDAVAQNVPTLEVAALFQKDPQVLIAHPDQGIDKFTDLKNLTLFVSQEGMASYYQWLKADYGFKDAQVKPYTFNPQPFLANKKSAMQGYVTSEPFAIEKRRAFTPKVFLLADQGFDAYSTLIETRRDLVEKKPDLVQRFVDASIIGWYNYIYGDNRPANDLIKKQNPEMTDDLFAYSVATMKQYGIVDSGDAGDARHRRHDRCAHQGFFRQDGARRCRQVRPRLSKGLYAAIRRQEGRVEFEAEALTMPAATAPLIRSRIGGATRRRQDVSERHGRAQGLDFDVRASDSCRSLAPRAAANLRHCASSPD